MKIRYPSKPRVTCAAAILALMTAPCASLRAQDAASVDDPVYELEMFVVETTSSRGYTNAISSSATSFKLPVRDTPVNMDFVTAELIEDLQADDMKEALDYQAGVFLSTFENESAANESTSTSDVSPSSNLNVNNPFADTIVIRGYPVPNQQRLGFRVGSIVPAYGVVLGGFTDSANTERLEVVKGPQSLLYGINVLSGIVNIIPKRPLPVQQGRVSVTMGSDDYWRASMEYMAPAIKDQLEYRFTASHTTTGHWTDYRHDQRDYGALQFNWHPREWVTVFIEGQYGSAVRKGGGEQFFRDNANGANDQDLRNAYGERYAFGYDYFDTDVIDNPAYETVINEYGEKVNGMTKLVNRPANTYDFPSLGDTYRISGPDVRREQEEYDLLAMVNLNPFRNFEIELGAYYTNVDIQERNVSLAVVNNTRGTLTPGNGMGDNPELDPNDRTPAGQPGWLQGNTLTWGIGELFQAPNPFADSVTASNAVYNDVKLGRHIWYNQPTASESLQLRMRIGYTFETDWFDGRFRAQHVITGGLNYTEDDVSFVTGGVSEATAYTEGKQDSDPYFLRSIFDYSVLRYTDQPLAIPGTISFNALPGISTSDGVDDYVARSGWREARLWYKGQYAIYYGKFLKDRLHILGGIRRDAYQVLEKEYLRVIDVNKVTDDFLGGAGTAPPILDTLVGFGDQPYTWRDDLPDSINAGVENSINALRTEQPSGTVDYNFDGDQEFTTGTYGFSFRLTDTLSVFYNHSEGIFPNTGQRDGAYNPIDAEQTTNDEVGLKFEFLDGRLSGSLGYFKIHRDNAVWNWQFAPNPAAFTNGPADVLQESGFNPDLVRSGERSIQYGVASEFVEAAFAEAGLTIPVDRRGNPSVPQLQKQYDELVAASNQPTGNPLYPNATDFYYFVDYLAFADTTDSPFQRALDMAVRAQEFAGNPIRYYGAVDDSYSASRASVNPGANVLFEEEGVGFDGSLIFSPYRDDRYQLIFGFAHQQREVVGSGFQLAPGFQIDANGQPVDGQLFTTEYDIWVYLLGPDNFEDPKDPTTLKGSAVNGIDLSFVPDWNLVLWNKYAFREGPLEGFSIAAGVRWTSSIPTTAGVGGSRISTNRYPTPDVPDRYVVDLALSCRKTMADIDWTLAFKVNNLLDDNLAEAIATYSDDEGNSIMRHTYQRYLPISFRFSISAAF